MPIIKRAKQVQHKPEKMYQLVNDIASYQDFVPWCSRSELVSEKDNLIEASLTFSKGGLEKSFTTLNRLSPQKRIGIQLVNGPFEHLEGYWQFESRGQGSLVILDLDFEFNNKMTQVMFGPFFNQISSRLVDTFCARADKIYGTR